jgi:hypothetical protein
VLALGALILVGCSGGPAKPSLVGTWNATLQEAGGSIQLVIKLQKDGTGTIHADMRGAPGAGMQDEQQKWEQKGQELIFTSPKGDSQQFTIVALGEKTLILTGMGRTWNFDKVSS